MSSLHTRPFPVGLRPVPAQKLQPQQLPCQQVLGSTSSLRFELLAALQSSAFELRDTCLWQEDVHATIA